MFAVVGGAICRVLYTPCSLTASTHVCYSPIVRVMFTLMWQVFCCCLAEGREGEKGRVGGLRPQALPPPPQLIGCDQYVQLSTANDSCLQQAGLALM